MIEARKITHSYDSPGGPKTSLKDVTLSIRKGEFVALLGHNGCGKSTFARHLNALIPLQSGELTVAKMDAGCEANYWKIRKACGMVFQNPDNQFVASIVEEDITFGLDNYEFPESEISQRVQTALEQVRMSGYEKKSPHLLSGGQKQRIAIAGILAVDPDILIFDEATAMLDPKGRTEVLAIIQKLHEEGKTILMISHYVEESVGADRVVFMHDGEILGEGTPREMLSDLSLLADTGLKPPMAVQAYYDLKQEGICLPICPLTNEELVELLCQLH